jgi:hypothetical protein
MSILDEVLARIRLPDPDKELFATSENHPASQLLPELLNWHIYARAYKESADFLVDHIDRRDAFKINVCALPIIYLYRHYIELVLKDSILTCQIALRKGDKVPHGHNVIILWDILKKQFHDLGDNSLLEYDAGVSCYLEQLDQFDPQSFSARYPTDRKGKPTIKKSVFLDLTNLKDRMHELYCALEGISDYIDATYCSIPEDM